MEPRDHYASYSAVVYENLGRTLAPLVGMFGSFIPPQARGGRGGQDALAALGDMKPCCWPRTPKATRSRSRVAATCWRKACRACSAGICWEWLAERCRSARCSRRGRWGGLV